MIEQPEYEYEALVHGQLVKIKRYKAIEAPTPVTYPSNRAILRQLDLTAYKSEESHHKQERPGSETNYDKIRELPALDERIDWDAEP